MDDDTARKLGVENPRNYILFDAPKSNYAADLPGVICFKRGENGVLEYDEPGLAHRQNMADALAQILASDPKEYTIRQLIERKEGKGIFEEMAERFEGFQRRRDMKIAIDELLKSGKAEEVKSGYGGGNVLKSKVPF
jgi:hypothetical protein